MKNTFLSILMATTLLACNSEKEENWQPDPLTITLSGEVTTFDAGDGNRAINLDSQYAGTLSLDIQTDKPWILQTEYITNDSQEWLTPSTTEGTGKTSVYVTIEANPTEQQRKAFISIITTGEIPAHKKITIIQDNLGVLHITWINSFLLTENEMVFGPDRREEITIGNYDSKGDEVTANTTQDWINAVAEHGEIKLILNPWEGEGNAREAMVVCTNLNGGITKSIRVTQYASEEITPKSNWTIQPGNDKTTATNSDVFENIIDDDIHTHWQWRWGESATSDFPNTPYEFVINLGSPQIFNTFHVWQTQTATNGFVKDIQFKVSDDGEDWINIGTFRMSESSDEAEAHADQPYTYLLPGTYQKQYVRLIILSNVGDSKVNNSKNAYLGEFSIYLK